MILRPGFIYGTRSVGRVKLPLGVVGSPMEMVNASFNFFFCVFLVFVVNCFLTKLEISTAKRMGPMILPSL